MFWWVRQYSACEEVWVSYFLLYIFYVYDMRQVQYISTMEKVFYSETFINDRKLDTCKYVSMDVVFFIMKCYDSVKAIELVWMLSSSK